MGSRRDSSSTDSCHTVIKDKQKKICEKTFSSNYLGVQQDLEEVHGETQSIKDGVKRKLEGIRKIRGHTKDFQGLEAEYTQLEDVSLQKRRCLETLLYVTEIENQIQYVQSELEDRALYLTQRPKVFESMYRGEGLEACSRVHKDCTYALRHSWSWLSQVSQCLNVHIRNAGDYHQFFHDARTIKEDMQSFLAWMNRDVIRSKVETRDTDVMMRYLREVTGHLLDYQSRVEKLSTRSKDVHPIHLRKTMPAFTLKAKSLVDYSHREVSLEEGEECTILNNSEQESWQIRTKDGTEAEVPGIILVIPPPTPTAHDETQSLKEQVLVHWNTTICQLRRQITQFLAVSAKDTAPKELADISAKQKAELMKLVNEAVHILRPQNSDDPDFSDFVSQISDFRKTLAHVKPGDADVHAPAIQQWHENGRVMALYKEMFLYAKTYKQNIADHKEQENLLLKGAGGNTYSSKAYFERALPVVDIDSITKETRATTVKAQIYIHERRRGKQPVPPPRRRRPLKKTISNSLVNSSGADVPSVREDSKSFVITGVVDPRTRQTLSVFQALSNGILDQIHGTYRNPKTGETMSIPEAIRKGLICADYSENLPNGDGLSNGFGTMTSRLDTKIFPVSGILDPRTGRTITVKEAMNAGIIDPKSGVFRNPVTREEMSIIKAVQNGYVMADPALMSPSSQDNGAFSFVEFTDVAFSVSGVIDPSTGEEISLKRAMMDGIIDPTNSQYRNPHTGETISIADAIKQGLLKGQLVDPAFAKSDENTVVFKQLQVKKQTFSPGDPDVMDDVDSPAGKRLDPNQIMFEKVQRKSNSPLKAAKDSSKNDWISLEDAYAKGLLNFAKAEMTSPTGEVLPVEEAAAKGYLDLETLKDMMQTYDDSSLGRLISDGKFDPETGLVLDPSTGHTLSLQSAISQQVLDPHSVYFYDTASQKVMSLAEAIEKGRYDPSTGKYINPYTGEEMTLTEAEKCGLINTRFDPDQIADRVNMLSNLRRFMDTRLPCCTLPNADRPLSVDEVVKGGILDVPSGTFKDPATMESMTLAEAIRGNRIQPATSLNLLGALGHLSLQEMFASGKVDPERCVFIDTNRNDLISVQTAIEKGMLDPKSIFLVDKTIDNIVSLDALQESKKFDPQSGLVVDPVSGRGLTISAAIEQGIIRPDIIPEMYVDSSSTLKNLIDSNKVKPRSTLFVAPNNHKMSIRDALANGFLTMNSKVKLDPKTGNVILGSDEGTVRALVDVKEESDWLTAVETKLSAQKKPNERLPLLKKQQQETEQIKDELEEHEPRVKSAIEKSETLVEDNKLQNKDDGAQQIQKLKYSTSDLKVRFSAACTEAGRRHKSVCTMYGDLEVFYDQLQSVDQWLDQAIERSQDLQTSKDDIEEQYAEFKDFVEELRTKEDEMSQVSKMADGFRDESQEFEREADAYRQRLQMLPPIKEENDNDVIDDELESLEAKYKDISRDCAKHLEKLAALTKNKKTFDDMNDKLSSAYPQIEQKLKRVSTDGVGKSPDKDTKNLHQLKNLKGDLIAQERRLKDINIAGDRLSHGLADINMKKKADEIKKKVIDHKNKHNSLQEDITAKEAMLDEAVSQQQNVLHRLDGVLDWVQETENALNQRSAISLDRDKAAQQLNEQQLQNADIDSNKVLLERLGNETLQVSGEDAEATLTDLKERLGDIERLADARTRDLEEVSANLYDLDSTVSQMEGWLTGSIQSLKSRPKGTTQKAIKMKVDGLYDEKREKEFDMENLRNSSKRIMEDDRVCDEYAVKESLVEMESKWHELTELLVQQVSLEALTEIDGMLKYMDRAENEINTAEPVNIDPDTLAIQLRDHTSFNEDLNQKRNAVKGIINKCNKMLRETTNSQTDEIKSRLDSIRTQADIVCQLSAERLHQLESALPLATHFSENQSEIQAWLDEMEAEIKAQGVPSENIEQVKKQYDNMKANQQRMGDHKPFVEDLNATGLDLMELCGDEDAGEIQNKLATETMDNLLEDLCHMNRAVLNAEPIPAGSDKLKDELEDNRIMMEDLELERPQIEKAGSLAKSILSQGVEDTAEAEDIRNKVAEIADLSRQIQDGTRQRDGALREALGVSEKFFDLCSDTMSNLRDLKDNLLSQEPPGVDPPTVQEQQKELKELRKELGKSRMSLDECRQAGEKLGTLCGDPGMMEIRKQLEDIHGLADDVHEIARDREDDLKNTLGHAEKFQELLDSIMSWLPLSEHKLDNMKAVSSDPNTLRHQIEELGFFKSQIHPHVVDIQQVNQQLAALKDASPVAAEPLQRPVQEANQRWDNIVSGIASREASLNAMQLKTGELQSAMNDAMSSLGHAQEDLGKMNDPVGDPKHLETQMRKLQLLQSDIKSLDHMCKKIDSAVGSLEADSPDDDALKCKVGEMNDLMRTVQADAKDKETNLQEALRQTKKYLGEVDDVLQYVNDLRADLKTSAPIGALPESSESEYDDFMKQHDALEGREEATKALLAKGQELVDKCEPEDCVQVAEKLKKLRDKWSDTKDRAKKRQKKLEEHKRNVGEFHGTLKTFTDWLNNAEITMRGLKYPSKLVDKVTQQMKEHDALRQQLDEEAEKVMTLDRTGSYLKNFGRKKDTIYIKNLLVGIRLRWKKLQRRADERGRLLKQAHKEDKRFYDSWKGICDWLDESTKMLASLMAPTRIASASNQNIDELKRFQHQLAGKHPVFYSTSRLGRNLKDRCTKTDPERDILQQMLDELKSKWNSVRSVVSKSQNKLDEALLTSGRVADALSSLLEWLNKAEASLAEDQPILGDLDTIHMLIEQHKSMQQELAAREQMVAAMKASGEIPSSQLNELGEIWERVNHLSDIRENKLKESMKLAEEFYDVVNVMREFLPQAEAELKFRALPDDEVAIIQLIERHEKFQEDLRNHQECVDKIKFIAEEILLNCHPNAVRFVKYYLTITQTRWDQLLQRGKTRGQRLQDALRNIQGNAALVEELLAWLTDAHALLSTKERDPVPDDLQVVETLFKEHVEFHDDVQTKLAQGKQFGSNMRLNEVDHQNPRVFTLQNKWRTVWRMSVDRKKQLSDALDTLLELENFKNFDFDLWKQKYLKWIQVKKLRITDFFRRQDKDGDGFLSRDEFVNGMIQTRFPTNRTELNAVFDIFDQSNRGFIEYKDFIEALKPARHQKARFQSGKGKMTDEQLVHDEIEKEVSLCQCRSPFRAEKIYDGKYRFGEKQNIRLVRFLNSTVMVRVGGGWVTLDEFLETNDPCRAKGRTNFELRESLLSPDGPNQSITGFRSRKGSGTYGLKSRHNDTGYASSISSAGSTGENNSLRRSRVTSSMVNLSGGGSNMHKNNTDFGSTGSLNRTKRLSTSSTSINSPNRPTTPRTPGSSYASPKTNLNRSTTPNPTPSPSFRSRSTTPTPRSTTPKTSTPTRPGRMTPTFSSSGRVTPTSSSAHRRLPSTPKRRLDESDIIYIYFMWNRVRADWAWRFKKSFSADYLNFKKGVTSGILPKYIMHFLNC
ncbi:hypothetical protein ScPMuIL_017068 [Solemya velum]